MTMMCHSVNNNTHMGLVKSLCSNSNHLISLIPPNCLKFWTFTQLWYYTNLQTMCPANFRIWLPFDHTTSGTIISEIQRLWNKFIRLALRLPKYISVKLLHDSSGLPYVKNRLLSRATRTLERITVNPLVEESISSSTVNPAWDRFPTPLSIIRLVSL